MELAFSGRTALVTGGASGLGRAAAERLASLGARVVVFDCDAAAMEKAAGQFAARRVKVDVTDREAMGRAVAAVEAELGPVAVLVTAAGLLDAPRRPDRITAEAWKRIFDVNLQGTLVPCQLIGARMTARGQGSIVTIASVAAFDPGPLVIYGSAKAGVVSLTRALAGAWGRRGVRVNAVAPGYVRTPALDKGLAFGVIDEVQLIASTALGRLATAADVAEAVTFLASDAAGAITGVVLPVDAGHLLVGGWAAHGGFDAAG